VVGENKSYSPNIKWWFNGDLPWQNTAERKKHLKQANGSVTSAY